MTRIAALLLGLFLSAAVTQLLACDCVASSSAMPGTYELEPGYDGNRSEGSRGDLYELAVRTIA